MCCKARSPAPRCSRSAQTPRRKARSLAVPAMGGGVPPARAGARHFGQDLRPRDGRAQARHLGLRAAALAAGIPGADLAIPQPPRLRLADHRPARRSRKEHAALLATHRAEYGVDRYLLLALWGVEVGLRRSDGAAEIHAAGVSGAGGAGLGRAAPARLLGEGTAQRAGHRRARLEHADGDARLLGRRHGPHPVDAGGLAQRRPRFRRRRPRLAVRQPGRCAGLDRALPGRARQVPARRALGLRGRGAAARRQAQLTPPGRPPASRAPTARRSRSRTPARGAGRRCRAGRRS